MVSIVVLETCTGCGRCAEVCPFNVYEIAEDYAHALRAEDCIECCACVDACPEDAILLRSCL
ncbi:4Fe-4S binding protein [Archaeoglobus neptunius]|uniref:4Fe-4S binding protein n=1 Tax=Archaeoglobus neptunius TaxID=2798580 RepID=UPI001926CC1E|nr:4Fe-4S binding protein [Archaeoglobus neptunius]